MSSGTPCACGGGSWLEDTCLTLTVGASLCLPLLTQDLVQRKPLFLLGLTLLAYFCLFWFGAFTSNSSVPASPRARWPSRGAGQQRRLCSVLRQWEELRGTLAPGPCPIHCGDLPPLRAPSGAWFLTSSLVLQRDSKLMGTDSSRHHWALQEMGKSWHCAASWYKSWKFPFLILMYICKIVNQCRVCCTRKREETRWYVPSKRPCVSALLLTLCCLLSQENMLPFGNSRDPLHRAQPPLAFSEVVQQLLLLPYFLGYTGVKAVPTITSMRFT